MAKILVAVDRSRYAYGVATRGVQLAGLLKSELTILSVVNSNPMATVSAKDEADTLKGFHRELIFKHFPANQVKLESDSSPGIVYGCGPRGELRIRSRVEIGDPVETICRCADEINADLIIIGNRGLGNVGVMVLGSVSEKVVRKSSRTVMVVKEASSDSSDWERLGGTGKTRQSFTV